MNKLEIDKTIASLNSNLKALKSDIDPTKLSKEDKKGVQLELAKTIRLALKIKLKAQQSKLENIIKALDDDQDLDLLQLQQTTNDLDKVLSVIKHKTA